MLASVFDVAGYFLGDHLLPPGPGNELGFFESELVNAINEDLLDQIVPTRSSLPILRRFHRDRPRRFQRWAARPASLDYTLQVSGDVERRIQEQCRPPFCLKDPRFSFTLPAWKPAERDAVVICVFRHPAAAVSSVLKQGSAHPLLRDFLMTEHEQYRVWHDQYAQLLRWDQELPAEWIFVSYEQLLDGPVALAEIARRVGAPLDIDIPDPSRRSVDRSEGAPPSCMAVYERLLKRATRCA